MNATAKLQIETGCKLVELPWVPSRNLGRSTFVKDTENSVSEMAAHSQRSSPRIKQISQDQTDCSVDVNESLLAH